MKKEKEKYLFQFETQKHADHWMNTTLETFSSDVVSVDKQQRRIEFPEAFYFFWSKNRFGGETVHAQTFPADAIYVILDDPERSHILTYQEVDPKEKIMK